MNLQSFDAIRRAIEDLNKRVVGLETQAEMDRFVSDIPPHMEIPVPKRRGRPPKHHE